MTVKMRVRKCPTDDLALTNCAILSSNALNGLDIKLVMLFSHSKVISLAQSRRIC
ncbi:unnamed protein product [Onchocerca flexuosa]|uniref:Uncharacterized protein n=1 Tax=Onchocerca flexuosa TaxID=387005 RepID=A0A183HNJ7_9BILA|nr:unnamed protein product [Onchocerca flexuosa]